MKPRYSIEVTPGTKLYRMFHTSYNYWTISIAPSLDTLPAAEGRILRVCGKTMREHCDSGVITLNVGRWFRIRDDVTLDDFEYIEV